MSNTQGFHSPKPAANKGCQSKRGGKSAHLFRPFKSPMLRRTDAGQLEDQGSTPPQTPSRTPTRTSGVTTRPASAADSHRLLTPRSEPPLRKAAELDVQDSQLKTPSRPSLGTKRSLRTPLGKGSAASAVATTPAKRQRQRVRVDPELLALYNQRTQLQLQLNKLEEENTRLRMACSIIEKDEATTLDKLIGKWKRGCNDAADKLWERMGTAFTRMLEDQGAQHQTDSTPPGFQQQRPATSTEWDPASDRTAALARSASELSSDLEMEPRDKMLKFMGIDPSLLQ